MINRKEKSKEWIKKIRLAKYKSLYLNKKDDVDLELMQGLEELLIEDGFTKAQLKAELDNYINNEFSNKDEIIKVKVDEIIYDLVTELEKSKNGINTRNHPEYYYRIQEVVAMDVELASRLLQEAEERMNIEHTIFHNEDLDGRDIGNYTYYFDKKA